MQSADAQTVWQRGSGDWFEGANWSAGVPYAGIDAQIDNNGTAQISLPGATAMDLYLGYERVDSGNLEITGTGALTNLNVLVVGHTGSGTVTLEKGALLSNTVGDVGNNVGSTGTVLVEGLGTIWSTGYILNIAYDGTGSLTIRNHARVETFLGFVATNPGSSATVLVDGGGSTFSGSFYLGESGHADVTIQNGGTIAGTGVVNIGGYLGHSVVLVDGSGSTLASGGRLNVGDDGNGQLTLRNRARAQSQEGYIGRITGSDGAAVVEDPGSSWTIDQGLEVGGYGTGALTIRNGGAVVCGAGSGGGNVLVDGIGSSWSASGRLDNYGSITIQNGGTASSGGGSVGGTGTIDGAGSTWFSHSTFTVGGAHGHLTVKNGGKLETLGFTSVGNQNGDGGIVTVDGRGSTLESTEGDRITVGYFGPGNLNITNGGVVSSFAVDVGVYANGNIMVDGFPSVLIAGALFVGGGDLGGGGEPLGTGHVEITNQGQVRTVSTTIFPRGTIINNNSIVSYTVAIEGGLLGGGGYIYSDVSNGGRVSVGDPIGAVEINGDYTQLADGELTLDIVGTDPVTSDRVDVFGNVTLGGLLTVRLVDGFFPHNGDVFKLLHLYDGAMTGAFSQIAFPDLRSGFHFRTDLVDDDYQITALSDGVPATGFLNISTRMQVETGDNALIGGFILTGTMPKTVLFRAIGPSLTADGTLLTGRLTDPTLELRDGAGKLLAFNDNWMEGDQVQEIIQSGIPPTDPNESAIVATLAPGAYTAVMRGRAGSTGIGIVEAYDLAADTSAKLVNISTRGLVQSDDKAMIGGFIADNQAMRVLVRAIGPSLSPGVTNALTDPMLELINGQGGMIAANDDWEQANPGAIEETGLAPLDARESAVLATLLPGPYTAIVRGKNNETGIGLVEVYDLP